VDRRAGYRRGSHAAAWVRLVLVGTVALAIAFPVLFGVAWVHFAGGRLGWVPSVGLFALVGLATARLAVSGRWPVVRQRTTLALVAFGAIVGIAADHWAPPTAGRLRHEIDSIAAPEWRLTDEIVSGNALCFDYCTSVTREYHVAASADIVLDALQPALARYRLERLGVSGDNRVELGRVDGSGDIDLRVEVVPANGNTVVTVTATAD
jgi:hypothetical protein